MKVTNISRNNKNEKLIYTDIIMNILDTTFKKNPNKIELLKKATKLAIKAVQENSNNPKSNWIIDKNYYGVEVLDDIDAKNLFNLLTTDNNDYKNFLSAICQHRGIFGGIKWFGPKYTQSAKVLRNFIDKYNAKNYVNLYNPIAYERIGGNVEDIQLAASFVTHIPKSISKLKGGVNKKVHREVLFAVTPTGIKDFQKEKNLNDYIKQKKLISKQYLSLQYSLPSYFAYENQQKNNLLQKQSYVDFLLNKVHNLNKNKELNHSIDINNIHTTLKLLEKVPVDTLKNTQVALILDYDENNTDLYTFIKEQLKKTPKNRDKAKIIALTKKIILTIGQFYKDRILNRDGHTKNIILTPDGNIKYIDFGKSKFGKDFTKENKFTDINYLFHKKALSRAETIKRNLWRSPYDLKQQKHYPLHKLIGLLTDNENLINQELTNLGKILITKLEQIDNNPALIDSDQERMNTFILINNLLDKFCNTLLKS